MLRIYITLFFIFGSIMGVLFIFKKGERVGRQTETIKILKDTNEIQNKISKVGNISYDSKLLLECLRDSKKWW